eukprot:jgi/Chlat1/1534/Chrsp122S01804
MAAAVAAAAQLVQQSSGESRLRHARRHALAPAAVKASKPVQVANRRGDRRSNSLVVRNASTVLDPHSWHVCESDLLEEGCYLQEENQLESLKKMSKVVADSGDFGLVKNLILKAATMPEYKPLVLKALKYKSPAGVRVDRPMSVVVDKLAVDFGSELLKIIPGRVSTEVDAHLSYDTRATVDKAHYLLDLYAAKGVDPSRVYIKIASTWEGIKACEELEKEGIKCNMTLLFSFAQGVACAEAGAALISPFVGRILDWYKKAEGRDFAPHEDPGVQSVKRIYNYYKKYNYNTIIMAASFRNIGEIRELAGCDNITISPALLEELQQSTEPLVCKLAPGVAKLEAWRGGCVEEKVHLDEEKFKEMHGGDQMAVEKLDEGIKGFAKDQEKLEEFLASLAAQQ